MLKKGLFIVLMLSSMSLGYLFGALVDTITSDDPSGTKVFSNLKQPVEAWEYSQISDTTSDLAKYKLSKHIADKYRVGQQLTTEVVQTVYAYTDSTDFPSAVLVLAVIGVESSFNTQAISSAQALGLMQVKRLHHPALTAKELMVIEDNVLTGIRVLQEYHLIVGTEENTLMAYNVGITDFRKGVTNDEYVRKVLDEKEEYTEVLRY